MSSPFSSQLIRPSSHTIFWVGIFCMVFLITCPQPAYAQTGGIISFFMPTAPVKLASKTISLENRYPNPWVNNVFKDNILLTAAYLNGKPKTATPEWDTIEKPFQYEFTLQPGQVFAFHDTALLPQYAQNVAKTTNAHYSASEGYKSDGYLMGDGVCHLASLFYVTAKDAGLEAVAPVNHDFAVIPEIDKQYGVAIYADPNNPTISKQQNLYIRNNQSEPVTFTIVYNGKDLSTTISKAI